MATGGGRLTSHNVPLDVLEAPVPPMTAKPWPMLFSKNSCPMKGGTTSSGVCCDEMVPSPK